MSKHKSEDYKIKAQKIKSQLDVPLQHKYSANYIYKLL